MSIQAAIPTSSVPTTTDPNAKSDSRAQSLIGQIEDWATCPTTDPGTKKEIVDKLSNQLRDVYSEISNKDTAKQSDSVAQSALTARFTGVGTSLDLAA